MTDLPHDTQPTSPWAGWRLVAGTRALLVVGALAVGALFFGEVLLGGGVYYPGDAARLYLAQRSVLKSTLAAGRLPWWTPDLGAGYPLLAEGEVGALYPLNWITVGLFALATGLNASIVIHYAVTACGAFLFLRSLQVRRGPALFGALTLSLGGFYIAHLSHLSILHVAAWFPWLLLLTEGILRPDARGWPLRIRWAGLALVVALQFLAGHAQISLLCLLFVGAYALYLIAVERRTRGRWELWAAWCGALLVGTALAGPQLWASAQLTALSQRGGGLSGEFFTSYSFHPFLLATLVAPFLRGNPYPNGSVELMQYVGILPLALAGVGLLYSRQRAKWFFLAMALVGLVLSFGRWNPLYAYLERVPLLNLFRVPGRYFLWTDLGIVVLATLGLAHLLRDGPPRADTWVHWGLAGAAGTGALLTIVLAHSLQAEPDRLVAVWSWLPFLLMVLSVATVFLLRAWHQRPALALALLLLVADLYAYGAVLDGTFNATWPAETVTAEPLSVGFLRERQGLERLLTKEEILPDLGVQREALYPSMAMGYGLPSANIYMPVVPRTYQDYLAGLSPQRLNRLNVGYYLIPQLLPVDEASELYDVYNPFAALPTDEWLEVEPLPVARLVVESYLSHSADLPDGILAAEVMVRDVAGNEYALPLKVGLHTAEWAYERSDVRESIAHQRAPVASEWPARSGFPAEEHPGYTYRATYALPEGTWVKAVMLRRQRPEAYVRIERVRFVDGAGRETLLAHLVGLGDHEIVYRSEDVLIYRNCDVWPRAHLVGPEQAVMRNGQVRLADGLTAAELGAVTVDSYAPERVLLRVDAEQAGYVVLADQAYPGWRASVDGLPVPVLLADGLFRAVQVPAGAHTVAFWYRPLHR